MYFRSNRSFHKNRIFFIEYFEVAKSFDETIINKKHFIRIWAVLHSESIAIVE